MNDKFLITSLATICYVTATVCSAAPNEKPLGAAISKGVTVAVKAISWHELRVEMTSAAEGPLRLAENSLPWRSRYSMWVKAFKSDAVGSALDEKLTISDPPINEEFVTLMPSQSLSGVIDLRDRFPEWDDILRSHEIVIFWSCVPKISGIKEQPRISGVLTLEKRRSE